MILLLYDYFSGYARKQLRPIVDMPLYLTYSYPISEAIKTTLVIFKLKGEKPEIYVYSQTSC